MKFLVTGATGQLGKEVTRLLTDLNLNFTAYGSSELNILDKVKINKTFKKDQPDMVFHCAAYTAVDKAEDEGKEMNWAVNVQGTGNIAAACKELDATMIYISTDYVFDGNGEAEYAEDDSTNPQNEYGKAKLAGEKSVEQNLEKYYIIRTSWVFGAFGNNFVWTMKKLAETRDELKVVNDQVGRPTWTKTLAEFMLHLAHTKPAYGIYHLSNDQTATWYDFAKEILKDNKIKIDPVTSEEFPQKAVRPNHSVMNLSKAKNTNFDILDWSVALEQMLKN
ncbi:dTDP-4-dehydrorhamnose reductase [Marinilactibacillus piezotolerans]|uniref:dTDP-4-dehydrorhamnose reductase n=1 Tax=Marinilactibacillus piezotolerans TaxID=258723 RepID=UPI0009B12D9F|nr:dTDP-4-dehydrorhamnose reductase [Marinilactibacillus piezotolerans]